MRTTLIACAALLALGAAAPAYAQQQQAPPTCDAPEHRAFDFWIGEWDVYRAGADTLVGRSSIRSEDRGCVITEHFTSLGAPYSGRSLNLYDRATGHWEQFWVDSTGEVTRFVGDAFEGGMRLTDPVNLTARSSTPVHTRMTFTNNPDGSVRQHGEVSADGAAWETRYDLIYRRRAEQASP
jgi:hypothetical protein